ncbi:hypothetical protein [Paenibacillus macerans]|uniref:hypothetical protein n=1 Tax=Paenibacillus macerans TaxID=44252 RepID=UPI003D32295A
MKTRFRFGRLLAAFILALFMVFLLPAFSSLPAQAGTGERDAYETDYHRSHKIPLRLNSSTPHGKLFIDRTPHHLDTVPVTASFLLMAPWVRFRPLFCLLLKRLLLLPIKFTSMFVA